MKHRSHAPRQTLSDTAEQVVHYSRHLSQTATAFPLCIGYS